MQIYYKEDFVGIKTDLTFPYIIFQDNWYWDFDITADLIAHENENINKKGRPEAPKNWKPKFSI